MKIIDAHMHLPVNRTDFLVKRAVLLCELEQNGVSGAVVISDSKLKSDIGSMRDCMYLFRGIPNIWVVGGISPFVNFGEQLLLLEDGISRGLIVGIKVYCGHEPVFLNSAELAPVFILAEKYSVPVLFHSGWDNSQYSSPNVIVKAAKAHRRVVLICCHCCYPDTANCFEALAEYENVNFDISSLADSPQHRAGVMASLEKAIRAMPERFIFGSDSFCCNQAKHISFMKQLKISSREKTLLFAENAKRVFKISL